MTIAAAGMPDPNDPQWRPIERPMGEREIQQARAQALGFAFADLDRIPLSSEVIELLSADEKRDWRALPLKKDRGTLWVAFDEPDPLVVENVGARTGLRVMPVLCAASSLDAVLARIT